MHRSVNGVRYEEFVATAVRLGRKIRRIRFDKDVRFVEHAESLTQAPVRLVRKSARKLRYQPCFVGQARHVRVCRVGMENRSFWSTVFKKSVDYVFVRVAVVDLQGRWSSFAIAICSRNAWIWAWRAPSPVRK